MSFFAGGQASADTGNFIRIGTYSGSTRYVSFTINRSAHDHCPKIGSVVQMRFKSVNSTGFKFDGIRVYNGSPDSSVWISHVDFALGSGTPGTSAGSFQWSSWYRPTQRNQLNRWSDGSNFYVVLNSISSGHAFCGGGRTMQLYLK